MPKFKQGQSGNPDGRPVGSGANVEIRRAISEKAPEIIEMLINQALGGDTQAGLALLNKVIPNLKAANEPVQFELSPELGLSGTGESIVQAIANGQIALDAGTQLLSGLANLAKLQEIDEIIRRIDLLEKAK